MKECRELPFVFDRETYNKWIRLERYEAMGDELEALLEEVMPLVRPRYLIKEVPVGRCDKDEVLLGGELFSSAVLTWNLAQTDRAWAYVITCGREIYERIQKEEDPLKQYWIDALAELAVQFASDELEKRLRKLSGAEGGTHRKRGLLTFMNPGSADRDVWPLEDQNALFSLLGDVEEAVGVTLTEGCLMEPSKSISGFYFLSPQGFYPCWVCSHNPCKTRKAKFRPGFREELAGGSLFSG